MLTSITGPRLRQTAAFLAVLLLAAPVPAAEKSADPLPLTKVVLFNSGVGFYQRSGQVEGNAEVDLKFNVDDVNDLLKSLVLEDLGGGKISTVTYGSQDPITKTLQTFAIDLTSNPTLADLLSQVRGEQVEVEAPNKVTGTILGVEERPQAAGKETIIQAKFLNLLTEDGLRSLPLAEVASIKLVNKNLDAELRQALSVLALGHATDKKSVKLSFLGDGTRRVRVGYIQESPIWKTSYRLVLSKEEKPQMQGWAIVENTTEDDWKDLELTLVSGRPISFVMNLYQPLYVPRPTVEPELFASLRPQTYGQDMELADAEFRGRQNQRGESKKMAEAAAKMRAPGAPPADIHAGFGYADAAKDMAAREADGAFGQQGVQSVAQAADVGEMFHYLIDTPVTLPRQQSAMLPIVNGAVEAKKVSIYNASVHVKHPLNGLQLVNSTGLHLMQGPITVFDGGAYAGDAQIEDLPPGTERLISYAMDLDTEVAPTTKTSPAQLVSVRISRGTLYTSHKHARSQGYTVKNSGDEAKTVLVEYPLDTSWKLIAPEKPAETTRDRYRFAVNAEPGVPAKLAIEEEQTVNEQVAITNLNDSTIGIYIRSKVVSDNVKSALSEVVQRKQEIQLLLTRKGQLEGQIQVIDQEQSRIRQNMVQLDRNSDLYRRYITKFNDQESQIETLREQIAELQKEINAKQDSLNEYLQNLTIS